MNSADLFSQACLDANRGNTREEETTSGQVTYKMTKCMGGHFGILGGGSKSKYSGLGSRPYKSINPRSEIRIVASSPPECAKITSHSQFHKVPKACHAWYELGRATM